VVVLTANGSLSNLAWIHSRGDVIVLGSCVTWGLYTVATRDITRRVHPLVATFWMTLVAGAVFIPYTLATSGIEVYRTMQPITTVSLVFLGVFCLAVSFWLWAEGLKRYTAAQVGAYLYIEPLFTMVAAWLLLNEQVTLWIILGALLITAGVYVSERKGRVRLVEHDV
jgi:drug/metabolite transporter (DMT)-like permease